MPGATAFLRGARLAGTRLPVSSAMCSSRDVDPVHDLIPMFNIGGISSYIARAVAVAEERRDRADENADRGI